MTVTLNGTGPITFDSSGNVGVGTSSPSTYGKAAILTSAGSGGGGPASTQTNSVISLGGTTTGAVLNLGIDATGTAYGWVQTRNSGSATYYDLALQPSGGNVGIGTSSPGTNLDVVGTSGVRIKYGAGSGLLLSQVSSGGDAYINNQANANLIFNTNNVERMRIDSSGNGFFGTTTSYGRFTVVPTTTQYSFASNAPNSSGTYYHFHCLAAGTTVGSIASTSTTTTYATSSDYRLKHDVQTMTSGLATISALKPVTYKWNIDDSIGEGFIAHELAEHIPLAVVGEKDAINEDGSINAQSVDYSKIVVHLVAAVQELSAKVDAQAAEIAALKAKVPA